MSIATATDWFLVQKQPNGETCIWRIACWSEDPDGTVIGLFGSTTFSTGEPPHLAWPAKVGGTYKHLSELTPEELRAVQTKGGIIEAPST
jgi:hypothetical protein